MKLENASYVSGFFGYGKQILIFALQKGGQLMESDFSFIHQP